jgi:hypothetical protein
MEVGRGPRETANPNRHRRIAIAIAGLTIAGGVLFYFQFFSQNNKLEPTINKPALLWAGSEGYVEGATCAGCHRDIWETYRHTGMGRSFTRPRRETMVEDFTKVNAFFHEASDRHYRMYEKEGRYYQRHHQLGFDGRETNVVEKEIHFVLGSGNHARTYLHRTPEGRIFELP